MMSTESVAASMGAGKYAKPLENACIRFGIVSTLEKAHFLAQVAHESDGFRTATEYASGRAYEGRKDLGNIELGDGVRFKGRGLIQLTGRYNYRDYSTSMYGDHRFITNPQALALLPDAALAAGWYWSSRNIGAWARRDDIGAVTRKINGGLNGLADRTRRLEQAKSLFAAMVSR